MFRVLGAFGVEHRVLAVLSVQQDAGVADQCLCLHEHARGVVHLLVDLGLFCGGARMTLQNVEVRMRARAAEITAPAQERSLGLQQVLSSAFHASLGREREQPARVGRLLP